MLECSRTVRKKMTMLTRVFALLLPVVCVVVMLTQTVFAKNTYRINDGGRSMIHTTYATDPAAVLDEAGFTLGEEDTYTTQYGDGMTEITVQRKQNIRIVYSNKVWEVKSNGETVGDLLDRLNFTLSENDAVSVSLTDKTYDGMNIMISRTETVQENYTVAIPHEVRYFYDATVPSGEQVVLVAGQDGKMDCVATVCYVDGEEVSRVVLSQTVIEQPSVELVAVGTYVEPPKDVVRPQYPSDDNPQPPIETGKPVIGNGTITLSTGEVFSYHSTMQMRATAYTHTDPGCDMITATGTTVHIGTVAVDPRVIPYGTQMLIVSNDGKYVYGIATAEDCGGSIKNNRLDLYFPTYNECIQFGIRDCTVYFLG